jgi:hypothetical protein
MAKQHTRSRRARKRTQRCVVDKEDERTPSGRNQTKAAQAQAAERAAQEREAALQPFKTAKKLQFHEGRGFMANRASRMGLLRQVNEFVDTRVALWLL